MFTGYTGSCSINKKDLNNYQNNFVFFSPIVRDGVIKQCTQLSYVFPGQYHLETTLKKKHLVYLSIDETGTDRKNKVGSGDTPKV